MTVIAEDPPAARPAPGRSRWRALLPALPVVLPALLAAVLTAYRYDAKPFWRDEVYTLSTAGRPVGDMFGLLSERDAGLVGYYLLMHPWVAVSEQAWWIRLPGAVATVVLVALVAVLGRRVAGPAAGLVAGVVAALSPTVYLHGQEARPYPMALTAVVVTALLLLAQTRSSSRWRWPVLGATAVVAVALHPLVTAPAVAAVFGACWLRPGRAKRLAVVLAGVPAGVVAVGLVAAGSLQAVERPPAPATLPEFFTFWRLLSDVPWLGWPAMAVAAAGAVVLARRSRRPGSTPLALVLGLWAAAPVAAVVTLGLIGSYFNQRYASAALPALAVLVGVALTAFVGAVGRLTASRAGAWGRRGAAAAVVVALALLVPASVGFRDRAAGFDDPRGAAQQIAAEARPGDAVVYVGNVVRPMLEAYYPAGLAGSDRLDDALLVSDPLESDTLGGLEVRGVDGKVAALEPHQRVWLIGSVATATGDLGRTTGNARAAMDGRQLASSTDHGWLRVELWVR